MPIMLLVRSTFRARRIVPIVAALAAFLVSPCRAETATFLLEDLRFSVPGGQNGLSGPLSIFEPGVDGRLVWTYPAGHFESGVGTLLDLALPITTYPLATAIVGVEAEGITGESQDPAHDPVYQFQIRFAEPLAAPDQTVWLDQTASTFDVAGEYALAPGVSRAGEWSGTLTGGILVPAAPATPAGAARPEGTALAAAAPNPFRDKATLSFSLARAARIRLAVYSVDGRRVVALAEGERAAGRYQVRWDGRDGGGRGVSPGIYYALLDTPDGRFTRRMVRLE